MSETIDTFKDERGELIIRREAPGVILFIERGYLPAVCGELIVKAQGNALKVPGKLTMFVDAEGLDGYDPPVRTMPTDWLRANRARVEVQHMLVKSQIARMGLAVAGLVLGAVIKGHTTRRDFEAALRQAATAASSGARLGGAA